MTVERLDKIIETPVSEELSESFLSYSLSVIMSRAIPDVRDGLKPVHRRILYTMHEEGMRPDTPTRKSANVTGQTMAKWHPHGDTAIYDALVRLSQKFRMRMPLVYGHGNFGSLDDGPAAARYTECRLDWPGQLMLDDIKEDTVDFEWNYSNELKEPTVLPSAIPNLLVNGGSGIAVGMASNMAPHNLGEVVNGLLAMLENPQISLDDMMKLIPGPDLPGGASIIDGGILREAYASGRGIFKMRAVTRIEDVTARKRGIVITSLPFNVGPEKVIAKVKEMIKAERLKGVADIKDLSDMKGLKMLVECKTGFNPSAVLDELFKLTPLEESFGLNNVCLVERQPQTLGLLDLCRHYIEHRVVVIRRRTEYRLREAEKRAHLLRGLILALASIDEVVIIIRKAKDTSAARTALTKNFELDAEQASAILDMRLARLTSLEVNMLKSQLKDLEALIKEYKKLLSSDKELRAQVGRELSVVSEKYATPRVSVILRDTPVSSVSSVEIPDEPTTVVINTALLLGRFGEPFKGRVAKADLVAHQVSTTTRGTIALVTSRGRLIRETVVEVLAAEGAKRGRALSDYVNLPDGEHVVGMIDTATELVHALVTRSGMLKRLGGDALPSANKPDAVIIGLKDDDELVSVLSAPRDAADGLDLVILSSAGQLLRTPASGIPLKGAPAGALAGMKLSDDARVVAFGTSGDGVELWTLSDGGQVKVTPIDDYPAKGRGGAGVRAMSFRKGETFVTAGRIGVNTLGVGLDGNVVKLDPPVGKRDGAGVTPSTPVGGFATTRA